VSKRGKTIRQEKLAKQRFPTTRTELPSSSRGEEGKNGSKSADDKASKGRKRLAQKKEANQRLDGEEGGARLKEENRWEWEKLDNAKKTSPVTIGSALGDGIGSAQAGRVAAEKKKSADGKGGHQLFSITEQNGGRTESGLFE